MNHTYCELIRLYRALYVQTARLARKMRTRLAMTMIGAITLQSVPSCRVRLSLSLFMATSSSDISILSTQQLTQTPPLTGPLVPTWREREGGG